jgi:hypothetical protein
MQRGASSMAELSTAEKFYIENNRASSEKEIAKALGLRVTQVRKHLKTLPPVSVEAIPAPTPPIPAKPSFANMFIQKSKDKRDSVIVATEAASSIGDGFKSSNNLNNNPNVFRIPKND